MAYLKIDGVDFSAYTSGLKVIKEHQYNAQTNAAGDTVVDYINQKRTIEATIIPVDDTAMRKLQNAFDKFNISLAYRDPKTGALVSNVNCIIPSQEIEYYTIQSNKVMYNAFTITIVEL